MIHSVYYVHGKEITHQEEILAIRQGNMTPSVLYVQIHQPLICEIIARLESKAGNSAKSTHSLCYLALNPNTLNHKPAVLSSNPHKLANLAIRVRHFTYVRLV